jgi:hypothetical protein
VGPDDRTSIVDVMIRLPPRTFHSPTATSVTTNPTGGERNGHMDLHVVPIDKPEDVNLILGQAHFIKTVDDLHET